MNPDYTDRLFSVMAGMGLQLQLDDQKRMNQAVSESEEDVYDILVDAFGAGRVHEATLKLERFWPTVFIERAASINDPFYSHAERLHQLLSTMQRQVRIGNSDEMRLHEAPEEEAMSILLEAYGAGAVAEAERKLAELEQAVEDKEREILAAKVAKTQRANLPADNLEPV